MGHMRKSCCCVDKLFSFGQKAGRPAIEEIKHIGPRTSRPPMACLIQHRKNHHS